MTTLSRSPQEKTYHPDGYTFIFAGLKHAQDELGRDRMSHDTGHVSGPELLIGVKELAQKNYGLMARCVLASWGIYCTGDIGKMVFELIECGDMRRTPDDSLEDFIDVYDFEQAFDREYTIDTTNALART